MATTFWPDVSIDIGEIMANQVAARLQGDDYQHLTSWMHLLELKMPRRGVRLVTIEDETAGSADDVTIRHEPGTSYTDVFRQIKFHVDQRGAYSTETLLQSKDGGTSLLQKLLSTWQRLKSEDPARPIEIHLVSNWSWDTHDKLGSFIDGTTNGLKAAMYNEGPGSEAGKLWRRWQTHLGIDDGDVKLFLADLRFFLGSSCFDERVERAIDRMENLRLRHDLPALFVATGIVREWIKKGIQAITLDTLEDALIKHNLYDEVAEQCKVVHLTTIKKQATDLPPDYVIDWRDDFAGDPFLKGHAVKDEGVWNDKFLPELRSIESQIAEETGCRLIRARGQARLSGWFAFGHVFSEVARYTIEVDQNGRLWRTDAPATIGFGMEGTYENLPPDGATAETVAVGLSVTGDITPDVREHARTSNEVIPLLLLTPSVGVGRDALTSAGDAAAFAHQCKARILEFVRAQKATTVQLYYYGPLSGACFLGHQLNAIGANVQIMEAQNDRSYRRSFLL